MKKKMLLTLMFMMIFFSMCGFRDDENKVYDDADIFSDEEIEKLQEQCIHLAEKTELDVIVLTTYDLHNLEDWEYAADYFKAGGFGYEEDLNDPSGLIFMISLDPYYRSVGMFSMGIANAYYPDEESADAVLDIGFKYCDMGMYYKAIMNMMLKAESEIKDFEFANGTEDVIDAWYDGEYLSSIDFYEDYEYYSNRTAKNILALVVCFVIAMIVAGISVLIMNKKYKNVMTVHGGTYFEKNSFRMNENYDNFIRTDVTRVRIESSSGGSGGGGGRSRGGSRVGGGSRRF